MDGTIVAIIGLASALVGGGGLWAFLAARRKGSGRVATTEAERLWAEASSIRKDQADEIRLLRAEILEVRQKHAEVLDNMSTLYRELQATRDELATATGELVKAGEEIKRLRMLLEKNDVAGGGLT